MGAVKECRCAHPDPSMSKHSQVNGITMLFKYNLIGTSSALGGDALTTVARGIGVSQPAPREPFPTLAHSKSKLHSFSESLDSQHLGKKKSSKPQA